MNNVTKPSAISAEDIVFTYPDGHEVLKGLSCDIRSGEKVALIGPNGAGKSTFMSHLNGVQMATSGKLYINGIEVSPDNLNRIRRMIGIVFQDPDDQLFCPTVFDDVAFGPLNLGLPREEIETRATEALHIVGLDGFEERSSFHLSFGERKRLALATVLSYQPDILVFDEPSTNMDPMNRRKLIHWLQHCENTILLCTHDLDIALEVCNRCIVLVDGKIVADGPSSEILYDRRLLEQNNLELPLALMTHELLHGLLQTEEMDSEHRTIISNFLHAHRHVHGSDGHVHFHLHAHDHDHGHLHTHADNTHSHAEVEHTHDSDQPHFDVAHAHDDASLTTHRTPGDGHEELIAASPQHKERE
ncbi:MAG: cobalt/nickel transport system ATP-binding protein [Gammaproteobacteria bacterium]|nr:MAG: cobalt/nickel transport system ATP-binding protein [Gammaproteobacteria bacterium]TND06765.1 MAG: cobalt/nickel transport system ATP-binding protein [Gammaproteobacteria bacterium]